MLQDSVVAIIPEESLGDVLPVVHRSGYGHIARVIRGDRRPLLGQLQRAGVPVSMAPDALAEAPAVLLIKAAARTPMAAAMLMRHGANRVWTVSAAGSWIELEDMVLAQPNVHILPPRPTRAPASSPGSVTIPADGAGDQPGQGHGGA